MTWEQAPQPPAQPAKQPPASDRIVGILATIVYGICCVFQGSGLAISAVRGGGEVEVTPLQYVLAVVGLIITAVAVVAGIMIISSKAKGFLIGIVAAVASIAINIYSITQLPAQMQMAMEKANADATQKGAEMTESMIGVATAVAYGFAALVILIHLGFLFYCANRLSKESKG
jgi:glucan phosphoethanolaminetransferase (alkaline phosphatase superfamily)